MSPSLSPPTGYVRQQAPFCTHMNCSQDLSMASSRKVLSSGRCALQKQWSFKKYTMQELAQSAMAHASAPGSPIDVATHMGYLAVWRNLSSLRLDRISSAPVCT